MNMWTSPWPSTIVYVKGVFSGSTPVIFAICAPGEFSSTELLSKFIVVGDKSKNSLSPEIDHPKSIIRTFLATIASVE